IRWFGSRGKIFNVHFRNIRGGFLKFAETLPDDGDVDMPRALRTYHEVGYDGMIMPDHVPVIAGDTGGLKAFAFCFGYIQALLQQSRAGALGATPSFVPLAPAAFIVISHAVELSAIQILTPDSSALRTRGLKVALPG